MFEILGGAALFVLGVHILKKQQEFRKLGLSPPGALLPGVLILAGILLVSDGLGLVTVSSK